MLNLTPRKSLNDATTNAQISGIQIPPVLLNLSQFLLNSMQSLFLSLWG